MTNSVNLRALVLEMLVEIIENKQYSHLLLRAVLEKYQYLEKQERAFITRLTEGTIEHLIEIDYIIDSFSKTKVKKMKPVIRNILRMGVYQIKYMDSVPDSAVCNEAVKLAKKRGFSQLSGFVNGVLRTIAREIDSVKYPGEKKEPEHYLEIMYSMPRWIVNQWMDEYGYDKTKEMLVNFQKENPISIRTNTTKCTPEELKARLEQEGVSVAPIPLLDYAFDISGFDYLGNLESFEDGLFYVQDISSMMVAEIASPGQGDYVIDVCAAPGGKSLHIAQMLQGTGMVDARDLTDYKVELIEENIERFGLSNMKAVCMDATIKDEASIEKADVLICDLPCSGLGILGKKTDIRYKMTPEGQADLVALQRKILDTVWEYVKPGKTLVYSTCTIHKEENENNVLWFLETHKDFSLESMKQLFPGEETHDGFFIARLKRNEKK